MVSVRKNRDQSKDTMFRRFSRLVLEEGIIDEFKDRMYHKTPSEIKKDKKKEMGKKRRTFNRTFNKSFNKPFNKTTKPFHSN